MKQKPDRGKSGRDADGIRRIEHRPPAEGSRRLPVLAVVTVALLIAWLVMGRSDRSAPVAESDPGARSASDAPQMIAPGSFDAPVRARAVRVVARRRADAAAESTGAERGGDAGKDERPEVDAGEYIAWLRQQGDTTGIAAFPPPGTNPPRSGVLVPDDYALPEGFARHYQATDDGRQLPPVLALAPEYDLIGADGIRIELHGDRIVPPELAPPDLPIRMLEVPQAPGHGPGVR